MKSVRIIINYHTNVLVSRTHQAKHSVYYFKLVYMAVCLGLSVKIIIETQFFFLSFVVCSNFNEKGKKLNRLSTT